MNKPLKICLYAICKNEIKFVDKWWDYAKEADYVIVLDTGSDDGTPERLEELGATVYRKIYPKPFRFDVARNDSVDLAYKTDADIFMTTDFDEILNHGWADILRLEWNPEIHQRADYDDYFGDAVLPGSLNWIHARGWRWMFPCHEVMVRDGSKWYLHSEELQLGGKVILHHYQDPTKSRSQYLPLLKLRLEENPDDVDSWSYLMRELMYEGAWDELLSYEEGVRAKNFPPGVEMAWVYIWLASAYENKGMNLKAQHCLWESVQASPIFRTAWVSLARLISYEGRNELAEVILMQCLKESQYTIRSVFIDANDVWTWRLYDWLGVVCWNQGKFDKALYWETRALLEDPENEGVIHNYNDCVQKLREREDYGILR